LRRAEAVLQIVVERMECKCHASNSKNLVETGRIAFVLIDGLADVQIPALANLTPLEAAETSAMDAIAGTKFEHWLGCVSDRFKQLQSCASSQLLA
jgi:hypothetical protein